MRIVSPVSVRMSYYRSGSDLYFDGDLDAKVEAICSRCLREYWFTLGKKFALVLTPDPHPTNKNRGLNRDEMGLSFYQGEEIDLSPLVHEQTLLGFPIRPLCDEDCLGLCSECGADRNELVCNCGSSSGDPRMAVFRNLRVDR
jgi:uncharacterized protein